MSVCLFLILLSLLLLGWLDPLLRKQLLYLLVFELLPRLCPYEVALTPIAMGLVDSFLVEVPIFAIAIYLEGPPPLLEHAIWIVVLSLDIIHPFFDLPDQAIVLLALIDEHKLILCLFITVVTRTWVVGVFTAQVVDFLPASTICFLGLLAFLSVLISLEECVLDPENDRVEEEGSEHHDDHYF